MSSYNSYNSYYNTPTTTHTGNRGTLIAISIAVQILGVLLIYGFIRCCCPTSLKRLRPGLVLSDSTSGGQAIQPFVIQNAMPSAEPVQMGNLQPMPMPMPPPYMAEGWNPSTVGGEVPTKENEAYGKSSDQRF